MENSKIKILTVHLLVSSSSFSSQQKQTKGIQRNTQNNITEYKAVEINNRVLLNMYILNHCHLYVVLQKIFKAIHPYTHLINSLSYWISYTHNSICNIPTAFAVPCSMKSTALLEQQSIIQIKYGAISNNHDNNCATNNCGS